MEGRLRFYEAPNVFFEAPVKGGVSFGSTIDTIADAYSVGGWSLRCSFLTEAPEDRVLRNELRNE